jgi:pyridoxal phosphate enzyme (YggS family)
MSSIKNHLHAVLANINQVKPTQDKVTLVAVSKTQAASVIREAYAAGQTIFGENYLQECLEKQGLLNDLAIEWHFIGPIQSNKTQLIAQHFSWVHSIDRLKVAKRLNDARPSDLPPLQVCIQTNISHENTKSGVLIDELEALATAFSSFPNLKLRGLMSIPAPTLVVKDQRKQFKQLKQCFDQLNQKGFNLDTLSMGMSNDYTIAVEEGATIVRVGSKIFGKRTYN